MSVDENCEKDALPLLMQHTWAPLTRSSKSGFVAGATM